MSNELLQKVIDTGVLAGGQGGLLSPEQSNRFIDYIWDATSLGASARKVRMSAPVREIDKFDLGQRIARHATEAVDDGVNAKPTFTKIQLSAEKIRLDYELTTESLEDSIEGGNLEDTIARAMATQLGNDMEDLAINGDATSGDPLIGSFNGYRKLAVDGGATVLDAEGENISTGLFNRAYKALPRRYKQRRRELRFFAGSGLVQDYHQALVESGQNSGVTFPWVQGGSQGITPDGNGGDTGLAPFGIGLYEVPLFNEEWTTDFGQPEGGDNGYVVLTHPENHIWGVYRDVTVHREFAPKKDAVEYTVFTRQGVQIDNLDAYVVVKNIESVDFN